MGTDLFLVPKPFFLAKLKQIHELEQVGDQALDTRACEQRWDKVMRISHKKSPKTWDLVPYMSFAKYEP